MGNKQTIIPPESHRSDREIARQLIESKRLRSVHFSDSIGGSSAPKSSRSEDGSDGESPSLRAKDLRSNLMRQQKDRDPLFYYEIVKVLGVGSMGSVAMVRKRDETIGGSARRKLVDTIKRQKRNDDCYKIPVLGDCFRYCMENQEERSSSHGDIFEESLRTDHSYDGNESSRSTTSLHKAVTYALKSIHLNRVQDKVFIDELKNEIEILKSLDHPHIVRPIETFVHRNQLFIVMELCSGGDLYSRDPYTEDEAARIVESILSAVAFMHEKKIVHRDLKYENILFANETQQSEIKLIGEFTKVACAGIWI
jgi:serine/threonine protein kinase